MSSFDRLIEKILNDAKSEAELILNKAKSEVEALKEEARKEAYAKLEAEVTKFKESYEEEARRRIVEARVKAKERWLKEREALIDRVVEKVKERLAVFVNSPQYVRALELLIEEAAINIGGGDLVVQLNEKDSKLSIDFEGIAKRVAFKTGVDTKFKVSETNLRCIGGAIVSTTDRSLIYDNTLESRLERLAAEVRLRAFKILFAEE
ncbi:MAG: V-type ATP synthase subunit E family protein [Candidatus Nezhaarchaeota archaeon]|nr:V-type ATP synthase subunit E family protein [Candidatus Nezhaarchaeota archaeon]